VSVLAKDSMRVLPSLQYSGVNYTYVNKHLVSERKQKRFKHGQKTLSIITLGVITFSINALGIMTLRITTRSITS